MKSTPFQERHYPWTGHPLPAEVVADMTAYGETKYEQGRVRRLFARIDHAIRAALEKRVTAKHRELVAGRKQHALGVLLGLAHTLPEKLYPSAARLEETQREGEFHLGFTAGQALADVLLKEHGTEVRAWLRRAAGNRGGRS